MGKQLYVLWGKLVGRGCAELYLAGTCLEGLLAWFLSQVLTDLAERGRLNGGDLSVCNQLIYFATYRPDRIMVAVGFLAFSVT